MELDIYILNILTYLFKIENVYEHLLLYNWLLFHNALIKLNPKKIKSFLQYFGFFPSFFWKYSDIINLGNFILFIKNIATWPYWPKEIWCSNHRSLGYRDPNSNRGIWNPLYSFNSMLWYKSLFRKSDNRQINIVECNYIHFNQR